MKQRILITGGKGFVGSALSRCSLALEYNIRVSSRQKMVFDQNNLERCQVGDLNGKTYWLNALEGVDVVVHCAGRSHILYETTVDSLATYRKVNRDGTLKLARQAVEAGVKRFVFISSIGVNGLQTKITKPFSEIDEPKPHNAYTLSKWEAEQGLFQLAGKTGLEVVVIRPPLVYGFGAKGNFNLLSRAIRSGWPLPLSPVNNQRSFVGLDNLLDFILICIKHPKAANQTFLVSDGHDLSTFEFIRAMSNAVGKDVRLMPVPVMILRAAAFIVGKGDAMMGLYGNLQIDASKARTLLGWAPPVSVEEGLKRALSS